MGSCLVTMYKTKISRNQKIAFLGTFIIALFTHIYKFTNVLPYHDSLYNFYSSQFKTLFIGRWSLPAFCGISSFYDLPWINGLCAIVYIALTAAVIVTLFRVQNSVVALLVGGVLATSVTTSTTFYYEFTADGYMMAMLLSAIAVLLTRFEEKRFWRYAIACICLTLSCAIYQAYYSFAAVLMICYFVWELLNSDKTLKQLFIWIGKQVALYAASIGLYYIVWKLILMMVPGEVKSYQGISTAGFNLGYLKNGIKQTYITITDYMFPLKGFAHGVSLYTVINLFLVLLLITVVVVAYVKQKLYKQKVKTILYALAFMVMPIGICLWHYVSDNVQYYSLMLQGIYVVFILALLFAEQYGCTVLKKMTCALFVVFIFNNAIMANIGYYYMNMCYEKTYAESVVLMQDIRDAVGQEEFGKVAIIGNRSEDVTLPLIDSETGKLTKSGKVYHMIKYTTKSLLFDAEHIDMFMKEMYEMDLDQIPQEDLLMMQKKEECRSMPIWPQQGSVKMIDDVLVIKLGEI